MNSGAAHLALRHLVAWARLLIDDVGASAGIQDHLEDKIPGDLGDVELRVDGDDDLR